MKLTQTQVDAMGKDFETSTKGFIDFLLLDSKGYQKVIDGAQQVLTQYKPRIAMNPARPLLNSLPAWKPRSVRSWSGCGVKALNTVDKDTVKP